MMRKQTILAVLGAMSLGLTACSGGGGDGGGTPTPTPTATPSPTPGTSVCDETFVQCNGTEATIVGTVDKDLTLDPAFDWFLGDEFVLIGGGAVEITSEAQAQAIRDAGVTLTVPAGTEVRAAGPDSALIVTRGSRIVANGTAAAPITFWAGEENVDEYGLWGGVAIQGFAEYYDEGGAAVCHGGTQSYCNVSGEGGVGFFGGNDNADDSGVLRYVRIANGGLVAGPNNEVNGLTLLGVGHGTTVEYIQVHKNQDDAVEWFGGTVNAKYLVLTGNDDDDIDYDVGYKGNVQYALAIKAATRFSAANDPRGIEAGSSDDAFQTETNAVLANLTLIDAGASSDGSVEPGMRLRGAVTTTIYNTAVSGFDNACVRIDNANTDGQGTIEPSIVTLVNVIGTDCAEFFSHEVPVSQSGTGLQAFTYDDAFAIVENVANVGPTTIEALDNGSGFTFDQTDYIGAVEPGTSAANAWWAGWTIPGTVIIEQ
jgi:hypothetical protein